MTPRLQELFFRSAAAHPSHTALEELNGTTITYGGLEKMVREKSAYFSAHGIGKGKRVAVFAPKSIAVVSTLLAALDCGAAYIPIDPGTPAERLQHILRDLDPHVFIAHPEKFPSGIPCQQQFMASADADGLSVTFLPGGEHDEDLAYILYTSGSTGIPKGVCITHENALAFIHWAMSTFPLSENDRFSAIAPLHFDLSVFDLYAGFSAAATITLIDDDSAKNSRLLAETLSKKAISVLYATPSLLSLLLNFGKISKHDFSNLRLVLFAGEVFPVQHLHALMNEWKAPRFFNLYGPTETNVCTWFEIPRPVGTTRTDPYPIGKICPQLEGKVTQDGELLIAGPNVTPGYWNRSDLNAAKFVSYEGKKFYRTGDRIETDADGNLVYTGRIDRMIKKRGYRIEPEEVENVLLRHPDVLEAAVIAGKDAEGYTLLRAFIVLRKAGNDSIAEIKQHCMELLPAYMIPEQIIFRESLPKTSSGKIDLKQLEEKSE